MSAVTETQAVRVDPEQLKRFVANVYTDLGLAADDAAAAAEGMVRTDQRGQHTHGVWYLQQYAAGLKSGSINAAAQPKVERESRGTAVIDGDGGLGAVVAIKATDIAARKAREVGAATVLVRNATHFGAAGYYTLRLAEQGLVAIVAANTGPIVAAPGARKAVMGTQPISYCVPDPGDGYGPVMLDMALSNVAGTKVLQAKARGEQVPDGWLVGPDGLPSNDPNHMLEGGALVAMGGHKGYGLGMLVEILAAVLSGAAVTWQAMELYRSGKPSDTGYWITAMDVEAFMPMSEFRERLSALRAEIHAAPTAPGVEMVILPGEPEWKHETETREHGLEIDQYIWDTLVKVADEYGRGGELEQARK